MGSLTSPSSDGFMTVVSVKISMELNSKIEKLSLQETKGNKSEMIRMLVVEAIRERENTETMIREMAENETTKME